MSDTHYVINTTTKTVENIIIWDGVSEWTPPDDHHVVAAISTPVKNWVFDSQSKDYTLQEFGQANIGFTWDGTYIISNLPKPVMTPENVKQVNVTGMQTV